MTAHNRAKKGEIAKVVLMPGDPLRVKWIAENFLKDYKLVNDIRGMLAYTGMYNGKPISIMGHGMGIPSIGIYSWELYEFYDVDLIIRVGSAGSYSKDINVGDLMIVKEAYSDSTYANQLGLKLNEKVLSGDSHYYELAVNYAAKNNINLKQIRVHSSDVFYGSSKNLEQLVSETKAQAVEMESFGLFANALKLNKKAITFLTCSDSLVTHEAMPAEDRQTKFNAMINLSLEVAIK
ncbi:MAG: purine-nucleoside phosphorylase [Malacoplasma sp.]|nr:purine-nucleoside phosphorylase [Malacoplasma sp.]